MFNKQQVATSCSRTCCSAKSLLNRGCTPGIPLATTWLGRLLRTAKFKVFRHHKFCNKTCSPQQTTSCKYTPDTALYLTPEQGDLNQEHHLQRQTRPVTRSDAKKFFDTQKLRPRETFDGKIKPCAAVSSCVTR